MKKIVINHIVHSVTSRPKGVILVTGIFCLLSVISSLLFMEFDLTFKGMIGNQVEVVSSYDRIIRDFKVSGVMTVALEPTEEKQQQAIELNKKIDQLIFVHLDQSSKQEVLNILNDKKTKSLDALNKAATVELAFVLLQLQKSEAAKQTLAQIEQLSSEDRTLLLEVTGTENPAKRELRSGQRKLQNLPTEALDRILSAVATPEPEDQDQIVIAILGHMSIYDKRTLVSSLHLKEEEKELTLAQMKEVELELGQILGEFKQRALLFSEDLKGHLTSGELIEGEKIAYNDIVTGVLYSDEYSISKDQLMYLAMISPKKNIDEIDHAKEFVVTVDKKLNELRGTYSDLIIRRTGFAAVQLDTQVAMFNNFGIMMLFTAIGILLVFFLGLKSIDFPFLSMLPLSISVLLMFGLFSSLGTLNLFSIMTPIILFGLGIDYAIHIGSRYGEVRLELGPQAPPEDVLRETLNTIFSGLFIASTTTVFAFLSMGMSTINGFAESGILAATGVVSAFFTMIYVLPVIIIWREGKFKKSTITFLKSDKFYWLGNLANSPFSTVISIVILLVGVAYFFLPGIEIEKDGMRLTPQEVESISLSKDLEEKFGFTDAQSYFVIKGYDNLRAFRKEINREEKGSRVYPAINAMRVMDAKKAIRTFDKLGWDRDPKTLSTYRDKYAEKSSMMGSTNENVADLYEFIVRNYVNWDNDEFLVIVPPSGYVWDSDLTEMYINDLNRLEDKFEVRSAGFIKIWQWLLDHLMEDLIKSSLIAFCLMLLILLITMKSLRGTLICSLAMLLSFAATLSIVYLSGIKFNYSNVMAFPLIIGLGIDYIVHIYHRLVHEENKNVVNAISSTGKAVLLTTLTTLTAFGTISFSIHRGLAQIGIITCIGLSISLLSSLFLVPSMVKIAFRE